MGIAGRRGYTAEESDMIVNLIGMGKSVREVGNILGRTENSIRSRIDFLRKHGTEIRSPVEIASQIKLAAARAGMDTARTVGVPADPVADIRSKIADLKRREAQLTEELDDVRSEMAGIFAELTELIGAVS